MKNIKNMKKTFATLMATGLAFGSLTSFAFAAEQPDSSSKKTTNNLASTAKLGSLEDYVNGLSQLTKEEKSKLIAAYKNNTLNSEQDLLKKAGIVAAQAAVKKGDGVKDKSGLNNDTDAATVQAIDFKEHINGLDTLTPSEKSRLITAYQNDELDSVKDLWEKAGIAAAQPTTQASSENGEGEQIKAGTTLEPIDFKDYVNELKELTQAEKKALIAAYDSNDFKSVEELLKKAGIAAAQSAVQSESVKDKAGTEDGSGQGKIGKTLQAVDFAEFVNGLSQLTQAEKSKLIAAYKNNEMDSVQDLLKKAGISSTKGTAAVKPEKTKN